MAVFAWRTSRKTECVSRPSAGGALISAIESLAAIPSPDGKTIFLHGARCIRVPIRLFPAEYESCPRRAPRPTVRAHPHGRRSDCERTGVLAEPLPNFWLRDFRLRTLSIVSTARHLRLPGRCFPGQRSRCSILLGANRSLVSANIGTIRGRAAGHAPLPDGPAA